MLKRRTKTEFPVTPPNKRVPENVIVRFIIDGFFSDKTGIKPQGYYYYKDMNGSIVKLDGLGTNAPKSWDDIIAAENAGMVPLLNSNINLYDNIMQRLEEFTDLQFQVEAGENYGITLSDLEPDIDIV
jgi:hypothetical protein